MERHIFLIDDDEKEWKIFNEALKKMPEQFTCTPISSAAQAMKLLEQQDPDFIFMDFDMPVSNALLQLEDLKKKKEIKNTRFVVYCQSIDEELLARIKLMDVLFMKKPYLTSTLIQQLRIILYK